MKVGDLVILSDRRSTGLIVEIVRNTYRVLIGNHTFGVTDSQVWKVINESW